MTTDNFIKQHLTEIIDQARWAPSVHNTQPWQVAVSGTSINIAIDPKYTLGDGDPTGRQTIISLGIFTEAVCIAAEAHGLRVQQVALQDQQAVVTFHEKLGQPTHQEQIELLHQRSSDRSIYVPADVPDVAIRQLMHQPHAKDTAIIVVTDRPTINKIADLTAHGIALALSSPGFRKELSHYLVPPGSKRNRGIATKSLQIPWLFSLLQPQIVRLGISHDAEAKLEKRRWLSASGVVILTGSGDMPAFWFETGRTYLRVSLCLEQQGFSQATSAAIVEASNYHEDVEEMLGTNQRILAMIRFGRGNSRHFYSPRVPATELITSSL